jgi:hypothetical protein
VIISTYICTDHTTKAIARRYVSEPYPCTSTTEDGVRKTDGERVFAVDHGMHRAISSPPTLQSSSTPSQTSLTVIYLPDWDRLWGRSREKKNKHAD